MSRAVVQAILRREGRSLMQYLREVPPWSSSADQPAAAMLHLRACHELMKLEDIGKLYQKRYHEMAHMGGYPDFTGYNDMAIHYLLPRVIAEQKRLLAELERDRAAIVEPEIGQAFDQLIFEKQVTSRALEMVHTSPHTIRAQSV